jgi:hypothetical protein
MPKPCLKQAAHSQHVQKHAHFPPPSEEAKRYSGIEYDRTPISIAINELALPARGCGRTFDDLDAHQYRHHLKKLRCPKEQLAHHLGLSGYVVASPEAAKYGRQSLATDSGALPPLVHADTSESEEDEIGRLSEGEALRHYPQPGKSVTGLATAPAEPKRLRKAHARGSTANRSLHKNSALTDEAASASNFASCPGSSSCLGGF